MANYIEMMADLRKLKKQLLRGDKRELARRLGITPTKVSDCFDGFHKDPDVLLRLRNETQNIISERSLQTTH